MADKDEWHMTPERLEAWRSAIKRQFANEDAVDAIIALALAGLRAQERPVSAGRFVEVDGLWTWQPAQERIESAVRHTPIRAADVRGILSDDYQSSAAGAPCESTEARVAALAVKSHSAAGPQCQQVPAHTGVNAKGEFEAQAEKDSVQPPFADMESTRRRILAMPLPRNQCPGCFSAIYDDAAKVGWCADCEPKLAAPPEAEARSPHTPAPSAGPESGEPLLTPKEALASHLIDVWCADKGTKIPWAKAVQITAIVTGQPDEERDRLLKMGDEDGACGMCGRSDRPTAPPADEVTDEQIAALRAMHSQDHAPTASFTDLIRPAPSADVYLERNQVVAALAKLAIQLGYQAGVAITAIEGWSEDWHGCVYIDLPTGQVSWHFHDSHAHLFAKLPRYAKKWDGHDTSLKYQRVDGLDVDGQSAIHQRELLDSALAILADEYSALAYCRGNAAAGNAAEYASDQRWRRLRKAIKAIMEKDI